MGMLGKTKDIIIDEYLQELEKTQNKKDTLKLIIKKEKRTIIHVLDNILLIAIIIGLVYLQGIGYYERDNITIDTQGNIISVNDEYFLNITLEDYQNAEGRNPDGTRKKDT